MPQGLSRSSRHAGRRQHGGPHGGDDGPPAADLDDRGSVRAYGSVMGAYALPRGTDAQRAMRSEASLDTAVLEPVRNRLGYTRPWLLWADF
jgi:hypothetical protein